MDVTQISFLDLPFNKLFQDYITNNEKLSSFFEVDPLSDEKIGSAIEHFEFQNDREKTADLLKEYNQQFDAGSKTLQAIEKIRDENSMVVVTGQQLTLFGGPLFTVFKILSAIHYAKKWEAEYERPFIPVFWIADEDHDYEEIAELGILQNDSLKKVFLEKSTQSDKRVAEIEIDNNFKEFKEEILERQFDTDFTDQLWRQLDECYQEGATLGKAFGKLILSLFEDHGIVLAGTANPAIKEHLSSVMIQSVQSVEKQFQSLEKKTEELLSEGYHAQVHLQLSNLFWIDEDRNRIKLTYNDRIWTADGSEYSWNSEDLKNEISSNPDRFSPNVFLRPIMQNELLPDFAYIAGPGEVSYYAQMKDFYSEFDQKMPVIMPRFSMTVMESGISRIFEKLPFDLPDYNNRIEDLESEFIDQSASPDIEKIFGGWKEKIENCSADPVNQVKEIDSTLEGSSEKAIATFFTELDKLKGKVYRSVKSQEETQLNRIRKIKNNLFPDGNLQEREVAFIYFMNKYGLDIWNEILENLNDEKPDSHKVIEL